MNEFDRFLCDYREEASYSDDEVSRVARHVLAKLEAFLELPVQVLEDKSEGRRVWARIASPRPFAGGMGLSWRGLFYMVVVKGRRPIEFGATLFLYSGGRSLKLSDGSDFLELVYMVEGDEGNWKYTGWVEDEYGEFTGYNV